MKKCPYCGNTEIVPDDYLHRSDLIHEERCSNKSCRALLFATIKPTYKNKD